MTISFSDLWEKSEDHHKLSNNKSDNIQIVEELLLKVGLYKTVISNSEIPKEELEKVKVRLYGEILLTLTNLSLEDNVNVYEALASALQQRNIKLLEEKYPA